MLKLSIFFLIYLLSGFVCLEASETEVVTKRVSELGIAPRVGVLNLKRDTRFQEDERTSIFEGKEEAASMSETRKPTDDLSAHIQELVSQNDVNRTLTLYESLKGRSELDIGSCFYPTDYVRAHYGRSFEVLNEAARLSLFLSAQHGNSVAKDIIADSFPIPEVAERMRAERTPISAERELMRVLETPFSLNHIRNRPVIEAGISYLDGVSPERLTPISTMNAGYAFLLVHNYTKAFSFFYQAGEKGIPRGYIEAAQTILDERVPGDFSEVKGILEKAGDEGLWHLATCYRYGLKVDRNTMEANEIYKRVVIENKPKNPFFYRQYAEFCAECALNNPEPAQKEAVYKIAVDFLIKAADHGDYSAYKAAADLIKGIKTPLYGGETESRVAAYERKYERFLGQSKEMKDFLVSGFLTPTPGSFETK